MDDEIFDEDANELDLISQEWKRVSEAMLKDGYVTGASAGQDTTLQNGFVSGFKQGLLSCFLTSKMKGILKAVLAYHSSYEGNPITDDVVIDAQSILEDISQLETDHIAEDFLTMRIQPDSLTETDSADENICCDLNSMNIDSEPQTSNHKCGCPQGILQAPSDTQSCDQLDVWNCDRKGPASMDSMTLQDARMVLLTCPEINSLAQRCKHVLKRLHWTDLTIESLL